MTKKSIIRAIENAKNLVGSSLKKISSIIAFVMEGIRKAESMKEYRAWLKENGKKTYAKLSKDVRFIRMSHGNRKLADSKTTAFLIFNLPAIVCCPYATEACKGACYACKAEKVYPDVLPARYRNLELTKSDDFIERMVYTIETEYNSFRRWDLDKQLVVRIHESGDFYDKPYALKWLEIARRCQGMNVVFMAYTKSLPFFRGEDIPENFIVRASVWCDTAADLEKESYEKYPVYTAYTETEISEMITAGLQIVDIEETRETQSAEYLYCRCSDCGTCNACWNRNYKTVFCAIH